MFRKRYWVMFVVMLFSELNLTYSGFHRGLRFLQKARFENKRAFSFSALYLFRIR